MEIIELPTEKFYVSVLQEKFTTGLLKDHLDAVNYINQYYFEIQNGDYYFYDVYANKFQFKKKEEFTREVVNKLDGHKDITNYFKKNNRIFTPIQDFNHPQLYQIKNDLYINLFSGMLHKQYKKYNDYDDKTKEGVEAWIDYLREIACNNNEEMLQAYLKYYSQIARKKKTKVIIVKKTSLEGTGKSTEFDFMEEFVFGRNVCLRSNIDPLTTNYNKILADKLLVLFEELPTFSKEQWCAVSSKLKTYATEPTYTFRDPYEKPINLAHNINIQVFGNVESLKDSQGRRYVILDVNCSRKDDVDYFDTLREKCFNMNVGEAFYSYLLTKITDEESNKFYAQKDFPLTENKLSKIADNLHSVYKFMKYKYLLASREEKIRREDLYLEYNVYCTENREKRKENKNNFYTMLREIQIEETRDKDNRYFVINYNHLKMIAKRDKWLGDEHASYFEGDKEMECEPNLQIENFKLKKENKTLQTKNSNLQGKINELQETIMMLQNDMNILSVIRTTGKVLRKKKQED
jgi:hypothetical protein